MKYRLLELILEGNRGWFVRSVSCSFAVPSFLCVYVFVIELSSVHVFSVLWNRDDSFATVPNGETFEADQ